MLDAEEGGPKRIGTAECHSQAVHRVINVIRKRLDDTISLTEMAAVAHMSRFHFNRTFRQVTGLPPRRFLSALRVQAATRLLLDTDHSVTDICMDVGYNSLGTFIRRFSSVLGMSPMKLRVLRKTAVTNLLTRSNTSAPQRSERLEPSVVGRITAPPSFSGPIFIGLFASAIPEGAPVSCVIRYSPGPFEMARIPTGPHYIFAVGLPWPDRIDDYFNHDSALRGGGEVVRVDQGTVECGEICLRAAMPTDPPILVNIPILLGKDRGLCHVA